jgi:hypothetical protein
VPGTVSRALRHSSERIAALGAGEPLTDDTAKCQLKAMNRTEYFPRLFTDAQWSQLKQAFPTGVCDYTKAGVNQQATVAWMTTRTGRAGSRWGRADIPTVLLRQRTEALAATRC